MTSQRSGPSGSRGLHQSEDLSLEIHLIECGHGDTTLIRLPGDRWALIDCNLGAARVRERFFALIDEWDVKRLDVLCLTHPHRDHFAGMLDVVNHFTSAGRSIGVYCDSGVDPAQVRDLLRQAHRPADEVREYAQLHHRLDRLIDDKTITCRSVDEHALPIYVEGQKHSVQLIPIGPDPAVVRRMTRAAVRAGAVRDSVNNISLVLVLQVKRDGASLNALLAGDADREGLDHALKIWGSRAGNSPHDAQLDAVKVPHHGSARAETPSLFVSGRDGAECVAAISVGTKFRVLPDRGVMAKYMEHGWSVLVTTKRTRHQRRTFVLELAGRAPPEPSETRRQDITITWSPGSGLAWAPKDALVAASELTLYETALRD